MFKYIKLGKLLREVVEQGRQLKTVLYNNNQIKPSQVPMAYSLMSLALNNLPAFREAHEQIAAKVKTGVSNPYLLYVMMAEFINTGKIVGGGQLKRIILDHQHLLPKIEKHSKINKQTVQVRLRQHHNDFSMFEERLAQLGRKDALVPNMYHLSQQVYSQLTKDSELNLLQSSACVMQSFSSALPPYLLLKGVREKWGERKYRVIDACSAPGNKTVQLAQYNHRGRVFAFEKNQKRFQLLKNTIEKYRASNIHARNADFLLAEPGKISNVKFILLDPSCSGSGMLTNFTRDHSPNPQEPSQSFEAFCSNRYESLSAKEKQRVEKLHDFQLQLLNHAATFQPLRLSYSTCSIYRRENQDVVQAFLESHPEYRIKKYALPEGLAVQGFGKAFKGCVRVDPRQMQSDGFFVTVFTRSKQQ